MFAERNTDCKNLENIPIVAKKLVARELLLC